MYTLNKIVGYLISPAGFGMALVAAAVLVRVLGRRRLAVRTVVLALANFWVWSTPWMTQWMGVALEAEFLVDGRVPSVESLPQAEAIVLHGGGMGLATNVSPYAEMWLGADRVWHAARIWKAGKAQKILVTSDGTDLSTGPLLADLGVPKEAIIYEFGPRNTEEEAKAVGSLFSTSRTERVSAERKSERMDTAYSPRIHEEELPAARVLVVTSAWHMKRTMLMYQKYASNVEAIPAPCDFESTIGAGQIGGLTGLLPAPGAFFGNSIAFHEWLGYWGYKWLR